jgi:hypothetical protein
MECVHEHMEFYFLTLVGHDPLAAALGDDVVIDDPVTLVQALCIELLKQFYPLG